ncbi:hypothetical protein HDV00_010629 [Rhizophlyctis rosea]|nr:hypothetical protein HDV00_010629 [Rhizophlyctis rosea]
MSDLFSVFVKHGLSEQYERFSYDTAALPDEMSQNFTRQILRIGNLPVDERSARELAMVLNAVKTSVASKSQGSMILDEAEQGLASMPGAMVSTALSARPVRETGSKTVTTGAQALTREEESLEDVTGVGGQLSVGAGEKEKSASKTLKKNTEESGQMPQALGGGGSEEESTTVEEHGGESEGNGQSEGEEETSEQGQTPGAKGRVREKEIGTKLAGWGKGTAGKIWSYLNPFNWDMDKISASFEKLLRLQTAIMNNLICMVGIMIFVACILNSREVYRVALYPLPTELFPFTEPSSTPTSLDNFTYKVDLWSSVDWTLLDVSKDESLQICPAPTEHVYVLRTKPYENLGSSENTVQLCNSTPSFSHQVATIHQKMTPGTVSKDGSEENVQIDKDGNDGKVGQIVEVIASGMETDGQEKRAEEDAAIQLITREKVDGGTTTQVVNLEASEASLLGDNGKAEGTVGTATSVDDVKGSATKAKETGHAEMATDAINGIQKMSERTGTPEVVKVGIKPKEVRKQGDGWFWWLFGSGNRSGEKQVDTPVEGAELVEVDAGPKTKKEKLGWFKKLMKSLVMMRWVGLLR